MSITALSGDALAQAGVTSVADLARIVPRLSFTKTVDAQPVYFIRGIGYFDASLGASPAVTSYVDEVPLPYAQLWGRNVTNKNYRTSIGAILDTIVAYM